MTVPKLKPVTLSNQNHRFILTHANVEVEVNIAMYGPHGLSKEEALCALEEHYKPVNIWLRFISGACQNIHRLLKGEVPHINPEFIQP